MLRMTKFNSVLVRCFWLALLSQPVVAGTIYTWVDENGVTHYSQQPPEQDLQKSKTLQSSELEPVKVGSVAPQKVAAPEMTESEKNAALIKEKDAKQAQSICDNAKQNLDVLTTHTKLTRQDGKDKEPVAMTEEERQAAIAENQQRIKLFCDRK
ncbi:DUF4124 domain-containing protein [Shewanella sp. A25]|nr:DUF4124 domain-containing protein [Shewanella shenzhenensis]